VAIKRISTNLIEDSEVSTADIANNAITAAKITDGNITTAKLADLNVTAGKLAGTLDLTGKTITVATATTGDNDTSPASTAFVQQEIAALVDSSPSSLNTLNELAAALGDDASFSTTVTNSIATKLPLAGGTMTGNLKVGATIASTGGTTNNRGMLLAHQNNTNQSYVGRSENGVADTGNRITFDYDNNKMQLDSDGDIKLDADSSNIYLTDGGTDIGLFSVNNEDLNIRNLRSDKDIYFQGSDNGTTFTAFSLDMSAAGAATFNSTINSGAITSSGTSTFADVTIGGTGDSQSLIQMLANSTNGANTIHFGDATSGTASYTGYINYAHNTNQMQFATNGGSVKLVIDSSGNVGIGETDPETSLHIKNSGNSFLTLERSGTTGGTGKFGINMEGGSSQQTTMSYDDGGKLVIGRSSDPATAAGFNNDFILKGGFVGIKTVDPQVELHVTGNANISGSTTSGGVITANHIIRSDAGHNTSRVEAVYDDGAAQYDSNILMWVSEPGYTYDSGGIGVNVHESGHYYGRKYDNDYAVFMRFIKSDGSIQFLQNQGTSGTAGASQVETLKITANGTLRLATTGGIGFGTTNAADTLDEYEEGNFTPTFVASGGTAPSSQTGTGQYTRIGDVVHITGQIVWNGAGSGGSNLHIQIPFNLISDARGGMSIGLNSGINYSQDHTLHMVPEINTNVMYLVSTHYSVSGHTHLNYSNISNSGSKIFSFGGIFHTRD
jgi:hypothetical protein